MLNILPSSDKEVLNKLSLSIFGKEFNHDIGYVLLEDGHPVGFAVMMVGEPSIINAVGVIPEKRGQGYGDFLTRGLIFRLSHICSAIVIAYVSDYYKKFGFVATANGMKGISSDIVFPSDCGDKKKKKR